VRDFVIALVLSFLAAVVAAHRAAADAADEIALGSTVVSAIGYATQTILDYVPDPSIVGALSTSASSQASRLPRFSVESSL
jgi:hypothetical protein